MVHGDERTRLTHVHEGVWEGDLGVADVPGLPGRGDLRRRRAAGAGRPLPVPAHGRRDRPPPDQRGPAREPLGGPRRPRAPLRRHRRRRRHGHLVLGLGSAGAAACGSRATSTAGTAASTRCGSSAPPVSGSCSCPASAAAPSYKFVVLGADGAVAREGRPDGVPHRGAAGHVVGGVREPAPVVRRRLDDRASRRRRGRQADVGLRGAPRLVAPRASPTPRWATSSRRTARTWASPTSSSCPSWSTRSAARGATRSRRTTRRRRGSVTPTASASWSTPCTRHGIGVILDWVPAHFPKDEFALARFDGTPLYEDPNPSRGEHPDWGTYVFNFGRREVRNFLVANALYWLEEYHVDGLRVDAVASMLYLDYSREPGEWTPNVHGGRENLEAMQFLQEMNATVYKRVPGAITIAEESTSWPGVTRPTSAGRSRLRLQVEHGLDARQPRLRAARARAPRLPPRPADVLARLRLLRELRAADQPRRGRARQGLAAAQDARRPLAAAGQPARTTSRFMWAHPGKQLLFMGSEFGQESEWAEARELDWWLLDHPEHRGVQSLVRDMNRVYARVAGPVGARQRPVRLPVARRQRRRPQRRSRSCARRPGAPDLVVCVANFSAVPHEGYRVGLPPAAPGARCSTPTPTPTPAPASATSARSPPPTGGWHDQPASATVTLPPLGTIWLRPATARVDRVSEQPTTVVAGR